MALTTLVPAPKAYFADSNGAPAVGYKLFTYAAGTTTKLATYTDSTGTTSNPDPVILDSRGEADLWLPFGTAFKFTLAPPTDTDPPTNPVWTVDNIISPGSLGNQSSANVTITGGTIIGVTQSNVVQQDHTVSTIELDATADTTLAPITGLSFSLVAGGTYMIRGHLSVVSGASGGLKVGITAGGGLTATLASLTGIALDGTSVVANTTATALSNNIVAYTGIVTDVLIEGALTVGVAGTITVEAAQNASNATPTKVLVLSTFSAVRVS